MEGKPVNLRQFRKDRAWAEKRAEAAANAARHGQSKAGKVLDAAKGERARRMLDQHRIEDDEA